MEQLEIRSVNGEQQMSDTAVVLNEDVYTILEDLKQYADECYNSNSANTNSVNEHDQGRIEDMIDALEGLHVHVQAQPYPDYVDVNEDGYIFTPWEELPNVENNMINHLRRVFNRTHQQLANSQSARAMAKLIDPDSQRLSSNLIKCRNYLENYIKPFSPLDLPETTPKNARVPEGKRGI